MSSEITKPQHCVLIMGDIRLWIDDEKVETLAAMIASNEKAMINIDGRWVNKHQIIGIYTAKDMEKATRHKNGEWECQSGIWHVRLEKCFCKASESLPSIEELRMKYIIPE